MHFEYVSNVMQIFRIEVVHAKQWMKMKGVQNAFLIVKLNHTMIMVKLKDEIGGESNLNIHCG